MFAVKSKALWVFLTAMSPLVPVAAAAEPAHGSVAEFVARYPERAAALCVTLDLERPTMTSVRDACQSGDWIDAGQHLLDYYRRSANGRWLRDRLGVHDPGGFDAALESLADDTVNDIYLLQGVRGSARRNSSGKLDWMYRGPNGDREWTLFTNRHFVMLGLKKAYAEHEKPEYMAYMNAFLTDWIEANMPAPEGPDEYAMPEPWQPMSTASRLLQVWPQLFYYFLHEPLFDDSTRLLMLSTVHAQAEHLKRYHRQKHNHAVKEMAGLGHAAAAWPEFSNAADWSAYSIATLQAEIERQVYPTGVQKELSSHYQRTVLEYVAQYIAFSDSAGVDLPGDFVALAEAMADYLARTMKPDGHVIVNNDADADFVRDKLLAFAEQFDREDWRHIASAGSTGLAPPGLPSSYYPYAGQLISRSGWADTAQWSFFDAGPWGISHQHNDRLHVSLSVGQRNLLVDTGRVNYIKDNPLRRHIISSAAHNVVLIDGTGQGPQLPEREQPAVDSAVVAPDYDFAVASTGDNFPAIEGAAAHARAFLYLRDRYWLVVDRIETDRPRRIDVLWHFHPDVTLAHAEGGGVRSTDPGVANLRIAPLGNEPWSTEIVAGRTTPEPQGWYSPVYNTVVPAPTAVMTAEIDGSRIFAWLLTTAVGDVEAPAAEVEDIAADTSIRIAVGAGECRYDRIEVRLPVSTAAGDTMTWPARESLRRLETGVDCKD